jgi:hypothetical protein
MVIRRESRVLPPKRIDARSPDLFVLEKGAVRCASFR